LPIRVKIFARYARESFDPTSIELYQRNSIDDDYYGLCARTRFHVSSQLEK